MDQKLVEITSHDGPGFQPLAIFGAWRVALMNDDPAKYRRETVPYMERHNKTDEVFALLEGNCTLLIGDGDETPGTITALPMDPNKLYNVKQGVWHNLLGTPEMKLLIVENSDVSRSNSSYYDVTPDMLP